MVLLADRIRKKHVLFDGRCEEVDASELAKDFEKHLDAPT
jgi:hypothetical protein